MASIEVSLSTAQRRKNGKKNGNGLTPHANKMASFGGVSPASIFASIRPNTIIDTCKELEVLRNVLKDKENTIQNLQGQINCCGRLASLQPLEPSERRSAELKLQSLKLEEESRKSAIKKIKLTLEQIDASEANIDVRIKQAELEYELGREELGLLGVREELRTLQARLETKPSFTLYSSINSSGKYTLHCVLIEYDPKSPRFGAGNMDDKVGLYVLWAAENSGLLKGDRILEVNGKLTLSTTKEEMTRLLTVCPSKAEIVILRSWTPPPSAEDFLRRENLRLTHRISYLEDQVSELIINSEKSQSSNKVLESEKKQTEIFQKGSHVALLSPNLRNGSTHNNTVSCNSSSSPKIIKDFNENNSDKYQNKVDSNKSVNGSLEKNGFLGASNEYHITVGPSQKYHDSENYTIYPSKPFCGSEKIRSLTKKYDQNELASSLVRSRRRKDFEDEEHQKNLNNLKSSSRSLIENSYSLSDLERSTRRPNNNYSQIVDYSSETSCQRNTPLRDRRTETDEESILVHKSEQSGSESGRLSCKPTPPKKPVRLSVNKALSLQNVDSSHSLQSTVRKIKRYHKGEAPPPPILQKNKVNGNDNQYSGCDTTSSRASSRAESWKTLKDTDKVNFKWPACYGNKATVEEKWC